MAAPEQEPAGITGETETHERVEADGSAIVVATETGVFDSRAPAVSRPERSENGVRSFGDYEIVREVARGGMGVVFLARQIRLNRTVALKMILAGQLAGETEVRRFYAEAEAAAHLAHPGIVPVYEVGEHEGQHYFSMGYVDGTSLAARVAGGPLVAGEAATIAMRISEAIQYAHENGVIHRDLTPANVLIDQLGEPKITDFGLAKKLASDSGLTQTGQVMGTPSYMPPEQAEGREVSPAGDIYAIGAILYCLVTGRPPFQAATPIDTLKQVVGQDPVPIRQWNPSVPKDLETVCLKCLAKDPRRRYATAGALAEDLNRYLRGEPVIARPVSRVERTVKWIRRRPEIAALSASIALIGFAGVAGVIWQWRAARSEAEFANRRLYDVEMNAVQRAWEDGNTPLFYELLQEQIPRKRGGVDRRGFEWHYWRRKLEAGHRTFTGHNSPVNAVAFSPDGSRLASAGASIQVWDVATGKSTLTIRPRDTWSVNGIAFTARGYHIVAASSNRVGTPEVTLHDVATGHEVLGLEGDQPPLHGVGISPDGSTIAASSQGTKLQVWDIKDGQRFRALPGHTSAVMDVAFSPDGTWIASAGDDNTARIWLVATGENIGTLEGHTGRARSVAISPDGSRIATASWDRTVKVWEASSGQVVMTLKGHLDRVNAVAFSPDGSQLASASSDWTVKVWDAGDGRELYTLRGHIAPISDVAFSADGSQIASAGLDTKVNVWSKLPVNDPLTVEQEGDANSVAFSPDDSRVACGGSDARVRVWDTGTGELLLAIEGHEGPVHAVAFSADGSRIASASADETVRLWDARTGRSSWTIKPGTGPVHTVAFSPDGSRLASAGASIQVWDVATGKSTLTIRPRDTWSVNGIAFTARGYHIVAASSNRVGTPEVTLHDVATGHEVLGLEGDQPPLHGVGISPDGSTIAASSQGTKLQVWDIKDGQRFRALPGHTSAVMDVAFSPDGTWIASAGDDNTARIWLVATGENIGTLEGHTGRARSVAISPDGSRIATASWDRTVKVWEASSGQVVMTLKGHLDRVNAVAFSPDGSQLASASSDWTVKVWDAGDGRELYTLRGHIAPISDVAFSADGSQIASACLDTKVNVWSKLPVNDPLTVEQEGDANSVAFSPDDSRVACGGSDARVRVWDTGTGELLLAIEGHEGPVHAVAFSADGLRIASASADETVRLWDARTGRSSWTIKPGTGPVHTVAFSPDGLRLATAGRDQTVKIWDAATGLLKLGVRTMTRPIHSVIFTHDGTRLICAGGELATVWDAKTGKPLMTLDHFEANHGWEHGRAALPSTGKQVSGVARSADGSVAVTVGDDSSLKAWDLNSGREVLYVKTNLSKPNAIALSPDGGRIAVAGADQTVTIWDAMTGQQTLVLKGHRGGVRDVVFSHDGTRIASACASSLDNPGELKIWDAMPVRDVSSR